MWDGFIGKQLKRTNRNFLISNLVLLALPLSFGILGMRYWTNFFSGPAKTSSNELIQFAGKTPDRNYIKIDGDKNLDTGVKQITTTKRRGQVTGSKVSANYVALRVGDKALIVKAKPENLQSTQFTGELKPLPQDVHRRIVTPVINKYPQANTLFLPYLLDQAEDYNFPGYMGLIIGIPGAGLSIWNLLKLKKRQAKPELHPIAQHIAGNQDAITVIQQIDQEIAAAHTIGKTTISRNWLFKPTLYGMDSVRLENLVWFYQKVTTHRTNGIPTGKTYATVVHDRHGKKYEFSGEAQQVSRIMETLYSKAPWAVSGYNDDLQKMWQKSRNDMISAVDQRRQAA